MKMPDPILITGAARSGTSLVAGSINICGAFGGKMAGPNYANAKGMFENVAIREAVVKPYLRSINVDPLGQYPLPDVEHLPIPVNWAKNITRIIKEEGYQEGPWFYKGAKICLFWPVWYYSFPNAKWVIVRRRTGDIIQSCLKTGFMNAYEKSYVQRHLKIDNAADGWRWWVHQHEKRFVEIITKGINVKVVWPERMVNGDYRQMMELMEWLGLEWSSKVLDFVDPKLWKARRK